jgi:hypothetical protein
VLVVGELGNVVVVAKGVSPEVVVGVARPGGADVGAVEEQLAANIDVTARASAALTPCRTPDPRLGRRAG